MPWRSSEKNLLVPKTGPAQTLIVKSMIIMLRCTVIHNVKNEIMCSIVQDNSMFASGVIQNRQMHSHYCWFL